MLDNSVFTEEDLDLPNPAGRPVPVAEYVRAEHSPISHLAHDWELYSAILLSPAEERSMVREPAQAVPNTAAARIGRLRALLVPYISCAPEGDLVNFSKPDSGETHTSVWVEIEGTAHVLLACREMDAHDTGFELLACTAELVRPRLGPSEMGDFEHLLEEELRRGVTGEIDDEAGRAKKALLRRGLRRQSVAEFGKYCEAAWVATLAEYMHGLWHDVQIRVGPEHLPVAELRRRMELMARLFPPNEGYQVFDEELDRTENGED